MMNNSKNLISVIVPVYNVVDYLEACIDSILAQSYHEFELILVDDGSTDGSSIICDRYSSSDPRVTVIHKANGGLSDARNAALDISHGKYLLFLDSDDMISPECLRSMIGAAISDNADIVQGRFTDSKESLGLSSGKGNAVYTDRHSVFSDYLRYKGLEGHACNKLFASFLFSNLRFPYGFIQEDAWTTYKALFDAKKITILDTYTYYYRPNPQSIMRGNFDPRRFEILKVPGVIREFLRANDPTLDLENEIQYFTVRLGLKTYNDCVSKTDSGKYHDQLTRTRGLIVSQHIDREIWENKYILMYFFIKHAPNLYNTMIRKLREDH